MDVATPIPLLIILIPLIFVFLTYIWDNHVPITLRGVHAGSTMVPWESVS